MILIYQFSIGIVILLVNRIKDKNYNYKNILSYSMIFLSSHTYEDIKKKKKINNK